MRISLISSACLLGILSLSICPQAQAQDTNTDNHTIDLTVPPVALLDIEPSASKNITMTVGLSSTPEAGLDPIAGPTTNNTLWLNYSSIVAASATNQVSAKLDVLVPGIDIKLTAAAASGSGVGSLGTAASQITLTATDQAVVTGIGSCYTGNGASNGHNLTYSILPSTSDYGKIVATTSTVTVTYTIAE